MLAQYTCIIKTSLQTNVDPGGKTLLGIYCRKTIRLCLQFVRQILQQVRLRSDVHDDCQPFRSSTLEFFSVLFLPFSFQHMKQKDTAVYVFIRFLWIAFLTYIGNPILTSTLQVAKRAKNGHITEEENG